jgi:hypothetical protein
MQSIVQYLKYNSPKTLKEIIKNVRTNTMYVEGGRNIRKDKYKICNPIQFTVHQLSNHAARNKNMEKVPNTRPTEWRYVE